MSKYIFIDEFGFEDEVWGGDDHLTDGGDDPAPDAKAVAVTPEADGNKTPDADGNKKPEDMVPKSAVLDERKKRQASESDNSFLRGQIAAMQNQPKEVPEKDDAKNLFEGKDKDDLISVGKVQNAFDLMGKEFSTKLSALETQTLATNALMTARSTHTDFDQAAQFCIEESKTDPELAAIINSTPLDKRAVVIYRLGKTTAAYQEYAQTNRTQDIKDKINDNAKKPGVSTSAGPTTAKEIPGVNRTKSKLDGIDIAKFNNEVAAVIAGGYES